MIEIVEYRPGWPAEFRQVGTMLRRLLGGLAVRIDHIGSTSIPGLRAKDVIDIQITVYDLDPTVSDALSRSGYRRIVSRASDHVPPGADATPANWRKWLFKAPEDQRAAHIHIRVAGRPNQRYALLFRDYLRTHPVASQAYGRVKVALAGLHPRDSDAYSEAKDPVCDLILDAAEAWALATMWEAGSTDC